MTSVTYFKPINIIDILSVGTRDKDYNFLFQEMDIVSEEEPKTPENRSTEKSETEKLAEYGNFLKSEQSTTMLDGNFTDTELQQMAGKETEHDKQLIKFKDRIKIEPEQVCAHS